MTTQQIIDAISALAEVVKANSGLTGSDKTADIANAKIRNLIGRLP